MSSVADASNALCAFQALLNLAARRARVAAAKDSSASRCSFQSTTGVVTVEALKFVAASLLLHSEREGSVLNLSETARKFFSETVRNPVDSMKILVPSVAYTITNNLLLVAADLLEGPLRVHQCPVVWRVACHTDLLNRLALFGQLKILTTGLFTSLLLRRTLGPRRWVALVCLTISVAIVQISKLSDSDGDEGHKNAGLGLLVVLPSCVISGFAGVYFELALKASPISLWVRNMWVVKCAAALPAQFYAGTLPFFPSTSVWWGLSHILDRARPSQCAASLPATGRRHGPSSSRKLWVDSSLGLVSKYARRMPRLLDAPVVVKYADNILKNLATAISLVLVALISAAVYGFVLSGMFFVGALGVVYSTLLYADILKDCPVCSILPEFCGGKI